MPLTIAAIVSSGKATLYELQTVYSIQDAYDMLEVMGVDGYNMKKAMEHANYS